MMKWIVFFVCDARGAEYDYQGQTYAAVVAQGCYATTVAADPLYIASGETTFKPPAGPYLLEE